MRLREAEVRKDADLKMNHEMQVNGVNGEGHQGNGVGGKHAAANGYNYQDRDSRGGSSCLGSVLMFLLGLGVAGLGLAISLIWIYTEGKLDTRSVSKALPLIQADVEDSLMIVGKNTIKMYEQAEKISKPYLERYLHNSEFIFELYN